MAKIASLPRIQDVIDIVREAGRIVMDMRETVTVTRKPDGSPVTEADMRSNLILVKGLGKLAQGIGVVAEENEPEINERIIKTQSTYWAVDPLDVTSAYIQGGNRFSINAGLIIEGQPTLGVVYFPATDTLYFTGDDGRAYRQQGGGAPEAIHVTEPGKKRNAPMIVAKRAGNAPIPGSSGEIISYGQHRACLVAEGAATLCSEREGFYIWDTAPTHAIVNAAGGQLCAQDCSDIFYSGIMRLPAYFVGHPSIIESLFSRQATSNGTA